MRQETWFDIGLKIWGAICLVLPVILWLANKGRKQATVNISKVEGEVYRNIIENKLADLNLSEVIDSKVEMALKKFKDMLWDQQEEHFKVKLDMQERLMAEVKEKQEILREKQLIANEHQDCQFQINELKRTVEQLQRTIDNMKSGLL